jgi:hypothetical protein
VKRVTKKEEEEDEFSFFSFLHFIACPHPPFSFPFLGRRIFVVPFRCKPTSLSLYQHAATHSRLTLPSFHLLYKPPPLRIRNSESYGRIEATIVMQSKLMLCLYRWLELELEMVFFFCFDTSYPIKRIARVLSAIQYIAHILYKMVVTFFFFFSFFF